MKLSLIGIVCCWIAAWTTPETQGFVLSPQKVVDLALDKSDRKQEIEMVRKESDALVPRAEANLQWGLGLEGYYLKSEEENLSGITNKQEKNIYGKLSLQKKMVTGTTTTFSYAQTNSARILSSFGSSFGLPTRQVYGLFSVEAQQDLWQNFFGTVDRLEIEIARTQLQQADSTRIEELEDHVLNVLNMFWNSYIAHESLNESIASRERAEDVLKAVRRKSGMGYTKPGELARTQAEYKEQDSLVKFASVRYLHSLDELFKELNLEQEKNAITFEIGNDVPAVPNNSPIDIEKLRALKNRELSLKRTEYQLRVTDSLRSPTLQLEGRVNSSGVERYSSGATSEVTNFSHPSYYVGVNFKMYLDNDSARAEWENAKVKKDLAHLQLDVAKKQVQNMLADLERRVKANHLVLLNRIEQVKYREKSYNDLRRAFNQGRVDLTDLVLAANAYTQSQIDKIQATGNYHMSINQLAALRDELFQ
ncbi:MAG: TolC family protein [Bdellovibrionales bacterium]|nr:TolC family protein [Bdellovibrionales bacterium]